MSAIVSASLRSTAAWYWISRRATASWSVSVILSAAMLMPAATHTAMLPATTFQFDLRDMTFAPPKRKRVYALVVRCAVQPVEDLHSVLERESRPAPIVIARHVRKLEVRRAP